MFSKYRKCSIVFKSVKANGLVLSACNGGQWFGQDVIKISVKVD